MLLSEGMAPLRNLRKSPLATRGVDSHGWPGLVLSSFELSSIFPSAVSVSDSEFPSSLLVTLDCGDVSLATTFLFWL